MKDKRITELREPEIVKSELDIDIVHRRLGVIVADIKDLRPSTIKSISIQSIHLLCEEVVNLKSKVEEQSRALEELYILLERK